MVKDSTRSIADYIVSVYRQSSHTASPSPSTDTLVLIEPVTAVTAGVSSLSHAWRQDELLVSGDSSDPNTVVQYGYYATVTAVDDLFLRPNSTAAFTSSTLQRTVPVAASSITCTYLPPSNSNVETGQLTCSWSAVDPNNDTQGYLLSIFCLFKDGSGNQVSRSVYDSGLLTQNTVTLKDAFLGFNINNVLSLDVGVVRVSFLSTLLDSPMSLLSTAIHALPAPAPLTVQAFDMNGPSLNVTYTLPLASFGVQSYQLSLIEVETQGVVYTTTVSQAPNDSQRTATYTIPSTALQPVFQQWATRYVGHYVLQMDGTTSSTVQYSRQPQLLQAVMIALPPSSSSGTIYLTGGTASSAVISLAGPPDSVKMDWDDSTVAAGPTYAIDSVTVTVTFTGSQSEADSATYPGLAGYQIAIMQQPSSGAAQVVSSVQVGKQPYSGVASPSYSGVLTLNPTTLASIADNATVYAVVYSLVNISASALLRSIDQPLLYPKQSFVKLAAIDPNTLTPSSVTSSTTTYQLTISGQWSYTLSTSYPLYSLIQWWEAWITDGTSAALVDRLAATLSRGSNTYYSSYRTTFSVLTLDSSGYSTLNLSSISAASSTCQLYFRSIILADTGSYTQPDVRTLWTKGTRSLSVYQMSPVSSLSIANTRSGVVSVCSFQFNAPSRASVPNLPSEITWQLEVEVVSVTTGGSQTAVKAFITSGAGSGSVSGSTETFAFSVANKPWGIQNQYYVTTMCQALGCRRTRSASRPSDRRSASRPLTFLPPTLRASSASTVQADGVECSSSSSRAATATWQPADCISRSSPIAALSASRCISQLLLRSARSKACPLCRAWLSCSSACRDACTSPRTTGVYTARTALQRPSVCPSLPDSRELIAQPHQPKPTTPTVLGNARARRLHGVAGQPLQHLLRLRLKSARRPHPTMCRRPAVWAVEEAAGPSKLHLRRPRRRPSFSPRVGRCNMTPQQSPVRVGRSEPTPPLTLLAVQHAPVAAARARVPASACRSSDQRPAAEDGELERRGPRSSTTPPPTQTGQWPPSRHHELAPACRRGASTDSAPDHATAAHRCCVLLVHSCSGVAVVVVVVVCCCDHYYGVPAALFHGCLCSHAQRHERRLCH